MGRHYRKDNAVWKAQFGFILKRFFSQYDLDYTLFAEEYNWSTATIRYWFNGRSCPREGLPNIKEYLYKNLPDKGLYDEQIYEEIKTIFVNQGLDETYYYLRKCHPTMKEFAGAVLETCYSFTKNASSFPYNDSKEIAPTGKTQAVVFDFDGTLTEGKSNKTTWESIWVSLGYDIKCCQELHMQFNRGEISHAEWCKITEDHFRERNLHKNMVKKISSRIHLLKGTKETFQALKQRDIKIYIVSGSITSVIRPVIRPVYQYVDGVKANEFRFDENGILTEIIGTRYDFEGKANYISEISKELKISPHDILFVGNSINDQFAYLSGARTLCINPKLTDVTNSSVWNQCIPTCRDLTEILEFL